MPGIVGIISTKPADHCQRLVKSMIACMEHERFYTSGTCSVPELGFHGGWVALEESAAARQVFWNGQRNIGLLLSGVPLVNADDQREIAANGRTPCTSGGRLIQLYEAEGDRCFEKLNGLFSGVLIDKRRGRIILFNDRYGVDRIYWRQAADHLCFSSEAKALLRICPDSRAFDEAGVAQFLAFGCVLEGRTLFRHVQLLPGGSAWTFERGQCRKSRYFSPATWEDQPPLPVEAFEAEFQRTFRRILPGYCQSDSKIGISLTGGLDSRMIMACLPDTAQKPICYTFAGEQGDTADVRLAARVADLCGLPHRTLRIGRDFFADFAAYADRTVYLTDGCVGILGAHEIYLNAQARRQAPVRLTGVFGGEVLRGMSTLKPVGLCPDLFVPELRRTVDSATRRAAGSKGHPVTFAAFREAPWRIFGSLAACRSQVSFRTPFLDNELVALAYRMPEHLRGSPETAMRFVRRNNADLADLPTDMGYSSGRSGFLRSAFARFTFKLDYVCNQGLPHRLSAVDALLNRLNPGAGLFGRHKFLSYRRWFRTELASFLHDALARAGRQRASFWNTAFLGAMAQQHLQGRRNHVFEIDAVLTLEAVERLLIRGVPADAHRAASGVAPPAVLASAPG